MKVSPEIFLNKTKLESYKKNIFLVCGNEKTYIKKISSTIIEGLFKLGFDDIIRKETTNFSTETASVDGMLFKKKSILIYSDPKELRLEDLNEVYNEEIAIIFVYSNLKNTSKIKKYFDAHKEFVSIACYKLSREIKKVFLDKMLSENKIKLETSSYWFFLDNSNDRYQLFENEFQKLIDYGNSNITLKETRLLLPPVENDEYDVLFFSILLKQKDLIFKTRELIKSSTDAYLFIQRVKFFIDIIAKCDEKSEVEHSFPKYLFRDKTKFLEIFNKTNKKRLVKVYYLIKKTDTLIRKNDNLHLAVCQRFLLNLRAVLI